MTVQEQILKVLDKPLDELTTKILDAEAKYFKEVNGVDMRITEWHRELVRLGLIVDLMGALEKCVLPSDTLVSMEWNKRANVMVIDSVIERDGVRYSFLTEAIYAGGYNVQRLHLRYLIKTKMPRVNGGLVVEYKDKLKRLTKIEKIEADIANLETRISTHEANLARFENLTRYEMLDAMKTDTNRDWFSLKTVTDWDSVPNKENFDNDASKYFAQREEWINEDLEYFRYWHVDIPKKDIVKCNAAIAKLRKKLSDLQG